MKFYDGLNGGVPYATLDELATYSPEQISKLGEATFDEIVLLTITREKIYQESALIAATGDVIVTRAMDSIEAQIFAPGDDAVNTQYPVPAENVAQVERAKPVTYNIKKVDLQLAETRYFISNDAKLRGASDWLEADSARRAAENLAAERDKHVLEGLVDQADDNNDVAATATWSSASATPEDDVAKAIANIVKNSNIPASQLNKPTAFALIIPAQAFVGVTKLKLIRNITQPIQDFLQTEYKVKIVLTRQPYNHTSWPVDTEALVVPYQDPTIGFLATFNGGGIIPAQEKWKIPRGEDIFIRQWFRYIDIPQPFDGTETQNRRIATITGVAS